MHNGIKSTLTWWDLLCEGGIELTRKYCKYPSKGVELWLYMDPQFVKNNGNKQLLGEAEHNYSDWAMLSGGHILIKFAGVNLIVGLTFQIPIYRYRHNRSQNNFALLAYSNPINVGTDLLLFIGFSVPSFYTRLLIGGGGGRCS